MKLPSCRRIKRLFGILLVLVLVMTVSYKGVTPHLAEAEIVTLCEHHHNQDCYDIPQDHICSEDDGCSQLHSIMADISKMGSSNSSEICYDIEVIMPGHEHDASCEGAEIVICGAERTALTCGHEDCVFGEPCFAVKSITRLYAPENLIAKNSGG